MGFKDDYLDDLDSIFYDFDELASEHKIDNDVLTIIMRNTSFNSATDELSRTQRSINLSENAINKSAYVLLIRSKDVHRKFRANAMISLDGKKMFVWQVKEIPGIIRLVVGSNDV